MNNTHNNIALTQEQCLIIQHTLPKGYALVSLKKHLQLTAPLSHGGTEANPSLKRKRGRPELLKSRKKESAAERKS